jgi:hypothetical protein
MPYVYTYSTPASSSLSSEQELKPSSTVNALTTRRSSTESDASLESGTSVESCGHLLPNSSHPCPEKLENSGQKMENSGHGHGHGEVLLKTKKTESNKNLRRRRFSSGCDN